MSEPKHTPGPWHIEDGTQIIGPGDEHIAEVQTRAMRFIAGEWEANAHLIVAAPALLAAAKAALEAMPNVHPTQASARRALRAAIEQAEKGGGA